MVSKPCDVQTLANGALSPSDMCATAVEFQDAAIQVEAILLAEGLGVEAALVPALVRSGQITSVCERGVDDDEGRYRLTFFHKGKRLRLIVDAQGRLIRRSIIDFGDRPLPAQLRRAEP